MRKLGILGKLPEKEEKKLALELNERLSRAYANLFLPTVVFNPKQTKEDIKRSKEILRRLV